MIKLDIINSALLELLTSIENVAAEDIKMDDLVSKLLRLVDERQDIVDSLMHLSNVEPSVLHREIDLTEGMSLRAQAILKSRQDLLNLRKANKRRIGIYKNIESDR